MEMSQHLIYLHVRLSCYSKSFADFNFVVKRLSPCIARVFCACILQAKIPLCIGFHR